MSIKELVVETENGSFGGASAEMSKYRMSVLRDENS